MNRQQTIVCKDGSRQRIVGARGKLQPAAGGFQNDLSGGKVPQVDALLNVGIQLASGNIAERKRTLQTCEEMCAKRRMPAAPEPSWVPCPTKTTACFICERVDTWMGLPLSRGDINTC